jgi:hypothetical protein
LGEAAVTGEPPTEISQSSAVAAQIARKDFTGSVVLATAGLLF